MTHQPIHRSLHLAAVVAGALAVSIAATGCTTDDTLTAVEAGATDNQALVKIRTLGTGTIAPFGTVRLTSVELVVQKVELESLEARDEDDDEPDDLPGNDDDNDGDDDEEPAPGDNDDDDGEEEPPGDNDDDDGEQEPPGDNDDEEGGSFADEDFEQEQPRLVGLDLAAGDTEISLGLYDVPAGTYDELEIEIDQLEPGTPAADALLADRPELAEASMVIRGEVENTSGGFDPFTLILEIDEEQERLLDPAKVVVDGAGATEITLLLDTSLWFGDDQRGFYDPRVPDSIDDIEDAIEDSIDIDWD